MPDSVPIAFVDCETTHLDASIGAAWEVAVILREFEDDQHTDTEYVWQIRPNLATADPDALRIGRFEERFAVPPGAEAAWTADESGHVALMTRREAVTAIVNVLSGAVLVGSNPGFDDRHLRRLVGRGRAQWHYRPYDIVQLAAAKIGIEAAGPLPWSARALSRAVGVEPPTEDAAHTALGDARWARDVYDAATRTQTAIELEDARRTAKAEERAEIRGATLTTASEHLRTALFPAVYEDAGQRTAEGVTRAADELLRLVADPNVPTAGEPPAGRAAVLREAIDLARDEACRLEEVAGIEVARGARCVAYLLRKRLVKAQTEPSRTAAEAQPNGTQPS
ncbi:hypothetical protein ACWEQC_06855 [Streptomyces shenzhenensis]